MTSSGRTGKPPENTAKQRVLLGVLTPSSNTRLEPLTTRMLAALPDITAHFSRFRVLDVGLAAAGQFDLPPILAAAELLADAHVDSIVWSGTSGGWRGLDADRELCGEITSRTGIPATTSTLALMDALELCGAHSYALLTPYPDDMHAKIVEVLSGASPAVTSSRNHAVTASNWALSEIEPATLDALVRELAAEAPEAISVFCTNLQAAAQVAQWEAEFAIPVLDSVALAVWGALRLAGVDTRQLTGWGRLFAL
jgi:maleate isomerase